MPAVLTGSVQAVSLVEIKGELGVRLSVIGGAWGWAGVGRPGWELGQERSGVEAS